MSNPADSQARRRFLKLAAVGAATAPMVALVLPRFALADDLPHLDPNDGTAKALNYVDDASKSTNAAHVAGAMCANCQFFQGAAAEYGPCMLFPGKAVHSKGWCASYNKKAG